MTPQKWYYFGQRSIGLIGIVVLLLWWAGQAAKAPSSSREER